MTVRLSRQMRELLQTISTLCEAGVCDEYQLISLSTAQRKAMREMRRVPTDDRTVVFSEPVQGLLLE
jgi:hypothetical protein